MANAIEYVTPDILRTALEAQDKRFDAKLEMMLGAILARMDAMNARMDAMNARIDELRADLHATRDELRTEFRADLHATRDELRSEIRAAATGIEESTRAQMAALDDKYRDLPRRMTAVETRTEELVPRVEHIERTLFAPEPPKRRRRAQRR